MNMAERTLVVDGTEEYGNFAGDGAYAPFVVFDVDAQTNIAGPYCTRREAEWGLSRIRNGEEPALDVDLLRAFVLDRESPRWPSRGSMLTYLASRGLAKVEDQVSTGGHVLLVASPGEASELFAACLDADVLVAMRGRSAIVEPRHFMHPLTRAENLLADFERSQTVDLCERGLALDEGGNLVAASGAVIYPADERTARLAATWMADLPRATQRS